MDIELSQQSLLWIGGLIAAGGLALLVPGGAATLITFLDTPDATSAPPVDELDPAESVEDVPAPKGFAAQVDAILLAAPDATSDERIKYLQAALSRDQVLCLEHKA